MLRTICIYALCAGVVSTSTLTLFQTDYEADRYTVTPVAFEIPADVPEGWYPLRAVAEHLPIEVRWDGMKQEVVVVSEAVRQARPLAAERRFKASRLPDNLCIKRGVTYCSPKFLSGMLPGVGFRHEGQVYAFAGESATSEAIRGSERFRAWCLTALYRVNLTAPEEYAMIRANLEGVAEAEDGPMDATAYIYPKEAVCYIVDKTAYGAQLAGYIGHEAYHVWQHRCGVTVSEHEAEKYGWELAQKIIYTE